MAETLRIGVVGKAWLEHLAARQYSGELVLRRRKELKEFERWCDERHVMGVREVSRSVVEHYQRWLFHYRKKNGKPLAVTTQYHVLCTLKMFFQWLSRRKLIEQSPAAELEMPKLPMRLPREVLTVREVEQVMVQPDVGDALGLRDRAILETLYSTGVRRTELAHLLVNDVHHERGTLMVREGKGKKDRVVPLGDRALGWIGKYLQDVRPRMALEPDSGILFLSTTGEAFHPDYVTRLVRQYVDAANIGKKGSCHMFRHTMATGMLERGADIRFIQVILGHAQLRTTEVYTRVSISKLKEVHSHTHPAESPAPPDDPNDDATDDGAAAEFPLAAGFEDPSDGEDDVT